MHKREEIMKKESVWEDQGDPGSINDRQWVPGWARERKGAPGRARELQGVPGSTKERQGAPRSNMEQPCSIKRPQRASEKTRCSKEHQGTTRKHLVQAGLPKCKTAHAVTCSSSSALMIFPKYLIQFARLQVNQNAIGVDYYSLHGY